MSELGLTELVRLSANENPLGPSARVVEAVRREAERVHLYPDGGSTGLRAALGRRLGVADGTMGLRVMTAHGLSSSTSARVSSRSL